MENIRLIKGKHSLCTGLNKEPMYDSQGSFLVFDVTDGKLLSVPVSEESLAFFNLQIADNDQSQNFDQFQSLEANNSLTNTQLSIQHASWKDQNAVRRLIYAWKEHEDYFRSGKYKSAEIWRKIAIVLESENSQWLYTGTQCENKFKELRKKFAKVKDHNQQSGNSPTTCKFFNELEGVLGTKPFVNPVALASNLNTKRRPLEAVYSSQDSEKENDSSDEEPNERKKVKKTRVQRELNEYFVALREDARRREEARKGHHKELLAASDRAVATYKDMMEKLIDKL